MPGSWNIENGVLEYWNSGVMEKEIGVVEQWKMEKKERGYRNLNGLMRNTPVLLYSITPM